LNQAGFISLLPFIISIFFLLWKQDVVLPLIGGLFLGAVLLFRFNPLIGFVNISGSLLINTLTNSENIFILTIITLSILLFSLLNMGGFINALRNLFSRWGKGGERLEYMLFLSNSALFVDKNLASLLIGIFSKPLVEKRNISPCKHAYLLNSVAASLWTIIPLTSFLPLGIAAIGNGFSSVGISYSPLKALYKSIGFQYYGFFSFFVALTTVIMKKDILLMKRFSEDQNGSHRNLSFGLPKPYVKPSIAPYYFYGGVTTLFIVAATIILWISLGSRGMVEPGVLNFQSYQITFIIALFTGMIFFLLLSLITGAIPYKNYMQWKDIKGQLFLTLIYIILSMSMGNLAKKLGLFSFIDIFKNHSISSSLLPLIIFIISSVVSFLSGSSVLTIMTVTPLAIRLTSLYLTHPLIIDDTMFASIAAAFSGATFGDINSPFSVNFIVSTASSEAPLLPHFSSQLLYSLIAFFVTIIFGYIFFILNLNPYLSISSGILAIFILFMLFNKDHSIFRK
jgi:tetracycline resistance efflux pump